MSLSMNVHADKVLRRLLHTDKAAVEEDDAVALVILVGHHESSQLTR